MKIDYYKIFLIVNIVLLFETKILASTCEDNSGIRVEQGIDIEINYYDTCVDPFMLPSSEGCRLIQGTSVFDKNATEIVNSGHYLCTSTTLQGKCRTFLNVPGQYPTIADALSHAVDGDTILLAPGTYNEDQILVEKNNITIGSHYLTTGDESFNRKYYFER